MIKIIIKILLLIVCAYSKSNCQFTEIQLATEKIIFNISVQNSKAYLADHKDKIFVFNVDTDIVESIDVAIDENVSKTDFYVSTENEMIVTTQGIDQGKYSMIIKSSDIGLSWDTLFYLNNETLLGFDVAFDTIFTAVGFTHQNNRSLDSGHTWINLDNVPLVNIDFAYDDNGLGYLGSAFSILTTYNFGESFQNAFGVDDGVAKIIVGNENQIFFLTGVGGSDSRGNIFLSINKGEDWIRLVSDDNLEIFDLITLDEDEIFACGFNKNTGRGIILYSIDGGGNWNEFETDYENTFYSLNFLNDSTALIGSSEGLVLKWNKNDIVTHTIKTPKIENFYSLFPNPHLNYFYLKSDDLKSMTNSLKIFNASGNVVLSEKLISNNHRVNTTGLPAGSYFISVKNDQNKRVFAAKIIKL